MRRTFLWSARPQTSSAGLTSPSGAGIPSRFAAVVVRSVVGLLPIDRSVLAAHDFQGHVAVSTAPDLIVDRVLAFRRDITTDSPTENERLMGRVPEDMATEGNLYLIDDVFADDAVDHGPFLQGIRMIDEIRTGRLSACLPDFRATVEGAVTQGQAVAMRVTIGEIHRGEFTGREPTNGSVETDVMSFILVGDGNTVERRVQPDMLGMLHQPEIVTVPRRVSTDT